MRPVSNTSAHKSAEFAELVCSNSLGSDSTKNASGLLKAELRMLGSLIMQVAEQHRVPAGGALAVDRWRFAEDVTRKIHTQPGIKVIRERVSRIPDTQQGPVIIATGPLTTDELAEHIAQFTGQDALFFFDAASPIVLAESVDPTRSFRASRYQKQQASGDYINCPLDEQEYQRFYEALVSAESVVPHAPDNTAYFEGCVPIEVLAKRGVDTLRYGPMKPVGLDDPATKSMAHAVVQLRQDDIHGRMYNIVGFQTSLKWGEQDRVFRMIPALKHAEFLRYGVMHRNTYINAPKVLLSSMHCSSNRQLLFAGQIVGVEGYVESSASGLIAGINAARLLLDKPPLELPQTTMLGALLDYITSTRNERLQPMNANWGLLPPVKTRKKGKRYRNEALAARALDDLRSIL